MTKFQEWKITTKAVLAASAVAAFVAAGVAGSGADSVTVRNTSAEAAGLTGTATTDEGPTTTTTESPATSTDPRPPTTATTATTQPAVVTTTTMAQPAVTTTTTTAPPRTVDVALGEVVNDDSGTRVPVTVTVTNGTADVTVCLTSAIVENGSPYHGGLAFFDVSGSQTLEWSYQYASQHLTDVRIVNHLVDSRYGCRP